MDSDCASRNQICQLGRCIRNIIILITMLNSCSNFYAYFLLYKFHAFQFILKVAGEVMNVVVKAKNVMRVKVIVTPILNVLVIWCVAITIVLTSIQMPIVMPIAA